MLHEETCWELVGPVAISWASGGFLGCFWLADNALGLFFSSVPFSSLNWLLLM